MPQNQTASMRYLVDTKYRMVFIDSYFVKSKSFVKFIKSPQTFSKCLLALQYWCYSV